MYFRGSDSESSSLPILPLMKPKYLGLEGYAERNESISRFGDQAPSLEDTLYSATIDEFDPLSECKRADIFLFSYLPGWEKCLWAHTPEAFEKYRKDDGENWGDDESKWKSYRRQGEVRVSTQRVESSSRNGCSWCAILWKSCQFVRPRIDASPDEYVTVILANYFTKYVRLVNLPWQSDVKFDISVPPGTFLPLDCSERRDVNTISNTILDQIMARIDYVTNPLLLPQMSAEAVFRLRTPFPPSTSSDATLRRTLKWLTACSAQHPKCLPSPGPAPLPLRVIDVGEAFSSPIVGLRELHGQSAQYICLSHCWGKDRHPIKLTTAVLGVWKRNGIPIRSLPRTFADAVQFSRRLSIRYLWIDSLCIIQDDQNDWELQSMQMASIYKNSSLTIAASHSENDDGGLFHTSGDQTALDLSSHGIFSRIHVTFHEWEYDCGHYRFPARTPLLQRAWVFQERVLSPRVIHFGANEVAWECTTCIACECRFSMQQHRYGDRTKRCLKVCLNDELFIAEVYEDSMEINNLERRWRSIVVGYSGLQLTYPKDKFPALSGLVDEVQKSRGDDVFLAGLWKNSFIRDLHWYNPNPQFQTRPIVPQEYIAPTWSWAAVSNTINFYQVRVGSNYPWFSFPSRVLEVCCTPVGQNPNGQLISARVSLRGRLSYVYVYKSHNPDTLFRLEDGNGHQLGFHGLFRPDYDFFRETSQTGRHQLEHGSCLTCITLSVNKYEFFRLVLFLIPDAPATYVRVGTVRMNLPETSKFAPIEEVEESTINII